MEKSDQYNKSEEKKKKRNKSPNFIVEVLYNLSKAFYKILPMFKPLATKRSPESIALLNAKLEKAGKPFEMDADELNKLKFFTAFLFFFLLLVVAMGNSNTNFYFYAIAFGIVGFVYPEFFIFKFCFCCSAYFYHSNTAG